MWTVDEFRFYLILSIQSFFKFVFEFKQDFSPGTFSSRYQGDIDLRLCNPYWCNPPRDICEYNTDKRYSAYIPTFDVA